MKIQSQGSAANSLCSQTYTRHSVNYLCETGGRILIDFADMWNEFFSHGCHLLQPSVPGHTKTSHVSAENNDILWTLICVRMSYHCDVTFTECGPPLPVIISTTAFDECTGWLSFNCCIHWFASVIWLVILSVQLHVLSSIFIIPKFCCATYDSLSEHDWIHAMNAQGITFVFTIAILINMML